MTNHHKISGVQAREETITIPTYSAPAPDPNPMFLEKRVNQGANGRVYPNPITDHIADVEKVDQPYQALFLENDYLQLIMLPQFGGRIFGARDKTNKYDFFYRQHVIKPALIGFFGSWISGGAEFNWPMHHRPSSFMPVDYTIEEHPDGSKTVWLSENDPLKRMKGMHGICLYPDKAFLETKARLYNRTSLPQTFLWWENIAVPVNDEYQVFFPPDVTWVTFHSRQVMSHYPIARDVYCGIDFTEGVDISWYKNTPLATSYFATESQYEFFGGYDHGQQAGVIHTANRHISVAKKLFTWGTTGMARAWEYNLTDSDGPYAELMASSYSDNQPDFSWLQPYEGRVFSQFWYPIQDIGPAKNANLRAAVNLEVEGQQAKIGVHTTEAVNQAQVTLTAGQQSVFEQSVDLAPGNAFVTQVDLPAGLLETDLRLCVATATGDELISYTPERRMEKPLPSVAEQPPPPAELATVEELFLTGLHIEQYHHPTLAPETYWQEALRRDPQDARSNNALGLSLLRRGLFAEAETHFRQAIRRLTTYNFNPYDGEPSYNLGLALKYQGRLDESYDVFYKATWSHAQQSAAYYALAEIDVQRGNLAAALDHLNRSLAMNTNHLKGCNLKAAVLRRLEQFDDARALTGETIAMDSLDFWSRNELVLLERTAGNTAQAERLLAELALLMRDEAQTYLDVAFDYAGAGLYSEAVDLLLRLADAPYVYPMVLYSLGTFAQLQGDDVDSLQYNQRGAAMPPDYCFPSRLEEMVVLEAVRSANSQDGRAAYYLGNLLYDKRRYQEAIENWEDATRLEADFAIPWRNLGFAYFNIHQDAEKARQNYFRAFDLNPNDPRLLYELDLLMQRTGEPPADRLARLEENVGLVDARDSLHVTRSALYNQLGQPQRALDLILNRRFHPWEGGEGLIFAQYVNAHLLLGREALAEDNGQSAVEHFEAALHLPQNLGGERWLAAVNAPIYYYLGLARTAVGDTAEAQASFRKVADFHTDDWSLAFLSSLQYYQAMAWRQLGDESEARRKLNELQELTAKLESEVGFETSAPNFLPLNDDSEKQKRIQYTYLLGLAHLGMGETALARQAFEEVLALDVNHIEAQMELRWMEV